ncbi:MAG TPA: hypothetical protein VG847_14840 [Chitinophagaceae bacterium]|nr:hypothetical protein [Chitinophagaceae bacterium]
MKQLFLSAIIISSASFFFSCNKVADTPPTSQQVDSVKIFGVDSTELVKSLTKIWTDSLGNFQDSNIVYFYYDTTGRRIFWDAIPNTDPNPDHHAFVFSYNSNYQISHVKRNTTDLQDTGSAVTTDFAYDNENIIKSVTYTYTSGVPEVENVSKTSLPSGGYSLSTVDEGYVGHNELTVYNFDANGRFVSWASYTIPSAVPNMADTLIYDASGNIATVVESDTSSWTYAPETLNLYQMSSRATEGNEFATLNKILYNGVSQLPEFTFSNSAIGSGLTNIDDWYYYQFTNYPASSVTVYQEGTNSYVTFNPNAQFDSKNRIVSFRMYNGDEPYYYETEKLSYYK